MAASCSQLPEHVGRFGAGVTAVQRGHVRVQGHVIHTAGPQRAPNYLALLKYKNVGERGTNTSFQLLTVRTSQWSGSRTCDSRCPVCKHWGF